MRKNKTKTRIKKETDRPGVKIFFSPSWKFKLYYLSLFLFLGGFIVWSFLLPSIFAFKNWFYPPSLSVLASSLEEEPEKFYRRLDGQEVESQEKANLIPLAVMIENLPSVRPQAGLSEALVVYEVLVEGGATRFMVLFDPTQTISEIWPVRSARPYYLEWSSEYGALYAHCGGSPIALEIIRSRPDLKEKDLNQISRDGKYFWRDRTRSMPHNLLTSTELLNYALRDKGFSDQETNFRSWKFKDEAEIADRGSQENQIIIPFSGKSFEAEYEYDQEKNEYLRFNSDRPHLDRNNNEQIRVKNVIVQYVPSPSLKGGKGRLDINVGGQGKAIVFRDGLAIEGEWKKEDRKERTLFFDEKNREIELNRGNIWIHVVSEGKEVSY